MICKADRRYLGAAVAGLLLALPALAAPSDNSLTAARDAIARGDGVAAEIAGKQALEQGAARESVAALIGEGELLQGDLRDARAWLGAGQFDADNWERGNHALAKLEVADGNLGAAAQAFDRVLERGEGSALLWVDIGRMRYQAGEHHRALAAAVQAVARDGKDPRALEFRGQLERDAQGLAAALPWFARGLESAPDDMGLLGEYAATLGDLGRNTEMLKVARHMVEIDPANPRAYFLQAVLAARAGQDDLSRRLMWRTGGAFDDTPAGLLLGGVLEMRSGNSALAVEQFNRLSRIQPYNNQARLLLGRAMLANGEANEVAARLKAMADRGDASPYLLDLVGRAFEDLGRRDLAAAYLDRAAGPQTQGSFTAAPLGDGFGDGAGTIAGSVGDIRSMLAQGNHGYAASRTTELTREFPDSIDMQMLAGDVAMLGGDFRAALANYQSVSLIRRDWGLVQRLMGALEQSGRNDDARQVLIDFVRQHPRSSSAVIQLARARAAQGRHGDALALLNYASTLAGRADDPRLLADLAEAHLQSGDAAGAERLARRAYQLQRSNARVAAVLSRMMAANGAEPGAVRSLAAKGTP